MPAAEFVRFEEMAKRGHPFMGAMVIEDTAGAKPAPYSEALKEQQRVDLERGITFAQKALGLGVRWKQG
jgi:hypothetical protein